MAQQDGKFIRGALGPFIFRVIRGKQRVKIKTEPGAIKQTKKTKTAGKRFGMASSLGADIRKALEINVGTAYDPLVNERLTGVLYKILGTCQDPKTEGFNFAENSFSSLEGFDFNIHSKMNNFTGFSPEVGITQGNMQVNIYDLFVPAQFKFSPGTLKCVLTVSLALLRLHDGLILGRAETESRDVTEDLGRSKVISLTYYVPGGCLCLIKMSLKFSLVSKTGWKEVATKKMNPSSIIGAIMTPGTYEQDSRKRWLEMIKFQ